jgi:hypothetical protein
MPKSWKSMDETSMVSMPSKIEITRASPTRTVRAQYFSEALRAASWLDA